MLKRLLPREVNFFTYFESHAALTAECAKEFQALTLDESRMVLAIKRIKELEHMADERVRQCLEHLHKTFLTPFDRNEIHALITALDDIMDLIDGTARMIHLYEAHDFPKHLRDTADVLVRATELVTSVIASLRNMGDGTAILQNCMQIKRCETDADAIHADAVARLFKEEKNAIEVIKWREIFEGIETATDACEDVANIVEGIVLESV
jgi:predicted phosphate transport protein (TIGR00153 family)